MQRYTDLLSSVAMMIPAERAGNNGDSVNAVPPVPSSPRIPAWQSARTGIRCVPGLVGRAYAQCLAGCEQRCPPMPTPTPPPLLDPGCGSAQKTEKSVARLINQTSDSANSVSSGAIRSWRYCVHSGRRMRADRCTGDTWKRYVNSTGGGTDDKYTAHRIPTAKPDAMALIRIERPMRGPQTCWHRRASVTLCCFLAMKTTTTLKRLLQSRRWQ